MARLRNVDRPITKKINIAETLVSEVNFYLLDPFAGRTGYGSWSILITQLLTNWLEEQKKGVKADGDTNTGTNDDDDLTISDERLAD